MEVVVGLETFIKYFQGYEDLYVLIGGTACSLWLEQQGLPFRSTKDLDIVLVIDQITDHFVERIWEFISNGQYESSEHNSGQPRLYRFYNPSADAFPFMIELLTKNELALPQSSRLTPVVVDDEFMSLSAIVLDDDYYKLVMEYKMLVKGASIIPGHCLIPLKAKAWLELSAHRAEGDSPVRTVDIKKHRNDVFRLIVAMSPTDRVELPGTIRKDLHEFLSSVPSDADEWTSIETAVRDTIGVPLPSLDDCRVLIKGIFGL